MKIEPDNLDLLRRMPLFGAVEPSAVRRLLERCDVIRLAAGAQVFLPSQEADRFYVVLGGRVKIFKLSAGGGEQILHLYGPGQSFGEAAMWVQRHYPAQAQTLEDSTLLVITRQTLRAQIVSDPDLAMGMLAGLSSKLQEFNALIGQLSLKDVPARLASHLLDLARRGDGRRLKLAQTKRELAGQLGTVPETLSRAFARLVKAGAIAVEGPVISILDADILADLAQEP